MPTITINGPIGAGGRLVGLEVSHRLNIDYIDRLILARASKLIGATVQTLTDKEQAVGGTLDRVSAFFQKVLERSAMSGAGGEPYFGPGIEVIFSKDYYAESDGPATSPLEVTDQQFIEVTAQVITDIGKDGNVVIVGRGSNLILSGDPTVLNVGIIAPIEQRIEAIQKREHLNHQQAREFVETHEAARIHYFNKAFRVHPNDPAIYHVVINLEHITTSGAIEIVAQALKNIESKF